MTNLLSTSGPREPWIKAYSDIFIKYLFASPGNKDLLLDFINQVLLDADFPPVCDLEIRSPFNIKEFVGDKESVVDVKAVDESGRIFNIEIQTAGTRDFRVRSLYYWSRIFSGQLEEAEKYKSLQPVICINLLDYAVFPENDFFHSCFMLLDKDHHGIVLSDHLEIHFIEMTKMIRLFPEPFRPIDGLRKWIYFLKMEGQKDKKLKYLITNDETLQRAHNAYTRFTDNQEYRDAYERRLRYHRDYVSDLDNAREEGIEIGKKEGREAGRQEGLELGIEQGIEQGIEKVALSLLASGANVDFVAQSTGLHRERLEELKAEISQ